MTSPHHDELFLAIGRLEGKVDSLLAQHPRQSDELKEHDQRIRQLEHTRGYVMGWSAAIGAAISLGANMIVRHMM